MERARSFVHKQKKRLKFQVSHSSRTGAQSVRFLMDLIGKLYLGRPNLSSNLSQRFMGVITRTSVFLSELMPSAFQMLPNCRQQLTPNQTDLSLVSLSLSHTHHLSSFFLLFFLLSSCTREQKARKHETQLVGRFYITHACTRCCSRSANVHVMRAIPGTRSAKYRYRGAFRYAKQNNAPFFRTESQRGDKMKGKRSRRLKKETQCVQGPGRKDLLP